MCKARTEARNAGQPTYIGARGIKRYTANGNAVPGATRKRVVLDHEQKRQVARQIVAGKLLKQVAAEWGISLQAAYDIAQEYTVTYRAEKFPLDEIRTEA